MSAVSSYVQQIHSEPVKKIESHPMQPETQRHHSSRAVIKNLQAKVAAEFHHSHIKNFPQTGLETKTIHFSV
jgi:hypothetical protein